MGFLDKLNTPTYGVNGNLQYAYTPVGRENLQGMRPVDPTPFNNGVYIPEPPPQQYGGRGMFGPPGAINNIGRNSNNPTSGLLGIQNTTGFSQEAPNVVYDYRPEQFAQEMKLRNRELDIKDKTAEAALENNRLFNQIRQQNADTATDRNAIARMKAENPNLVFKALPGGNLVAMDPASGQVIDTGLSSGTMSQEGAINLRQQNSMAQIGARNEGNMNVANLRNQGMLEAIGLRNASAETIEGLRQSGALDRLVQNLGAQRANTIFKEGANTYRTRLREGDVNAVPPAEPERAPVMPFRSNPNSVLQLQSNPQNDPSGFFNGFRGFSATLGQYDAKPGQYNAPVQGKNPVTQQPVSTGNPQADAALAKQAEELLTRQGKPVTEKNIAYVMAQLQKSQSSTTPGQLSAGTVVGQPAGTLSGPSAGTVGRR